MKQMNLAMYQVDSVTTQEKTLNLIKFLKDLTTNSQEIQRTIKHVKQYYKTQTTVNSTGQSIQYNN